MGAKRSGKSAKQRPSVAPRPAEDPGEQRFRVDQGSAVLVGLVGGLMFVPPSVAWLLDLLRGRLVTDGADVVIVTGIGWTGLALVARFIFRPRLVLTGGELHENRLFGSTVIPLSAVTSIDHVRGRIDGVKPKRVDTLFLFRGHPHPPWAIDLAAVDEPSKVMAALLARCRVKVGYYTPQNAPPWTRG